jgi:peptidoglycan/LPS O-acetylase OafA/YrhL
MGMASSAKYPQMLRFAAIIQAVEAVGVLAAAILALINSLDGHSYSKSNGLAIAVLLFIAAILMTWFAWGVSQLRAWSRTPIVITQITMAIVAVVLVQGGRYDWGVPGIALVVAELACVLAPASVRALVRDLDASRPRSVPRGAG